LSAFLLFLILQFQYLNEDDHDAKKVQEIATLEQTIVKQKEVHEKNVEERKKILKELQKVIREKQEENKSLDKDLGKLNVDVNERRHIHEVNGKNNLFLHHFHVII
jgi:septal ring factor EnvC (AmiA/AmiB activator)